MAQKKSFCSLARQFQLEGLIAKRPDSLHEVGRRSGAWVKVKLTQQQEFVIGGYTHVYVKQEGRWRLVAGQGTQIAGG